MRNKEIKEELKKICTLLEKVQDLSILILNERQDNRKSDSATLLDEYLMGDNRNGN